MGIIILTHFVPDTLNLVLMLSFNIFSCITFNGNIVMEKAHSEGNVYKYYNLLL